MILIQDIERNMRASDAKKNGLISMYEYINVDTGVEIGCNTGCSTEIAAQFLKKLYCVDIWRTNTVWKGRTIESWFDERMAIYKNIVKIKELSAIACNLFEDESVDMVYIDANHSYESVVEDITLWAPKVKKGGWICGHDYFEKHESVIRAVNDTLGKPDKVFEDWSWIVRKL